MIKRKWCNFILLLLCLSLTFCFAACVDHSNKNPLVSVSMNPENQNLGPEGTPISGDFQIELYPDKAPNSVAYFIDFIVSGTYNSFAVSKVYPGNIVQFGDPWMSKRIFTEIEGEFPENGFEQNDIEFKRGTVGLALGVENDPDSASGDFFIILSDEAGKSYQGKAAAIGIVTSGLEVLDQISQIKKYPTYEPVYSIRTSVVTVDLKGVTYEKPVTRERRTFPGSNTD